MNQLFVCQFRPCNFVSYSFKRLVRHCWDKHSICRGFQFVCGVSGCTKGYVNIQSLHRHIKSGHRSFYELHYNKQTEDGEELIENAEDDSVSVGGEASCLEELTEPTIDVPEDFEFDGDVTNHRPDDIVANVLVELKKDFNSTTECTRYISEKMKEIIRLDREKLISEIKGSLARNQPTFKIDLETEALMSCESPFALSFGKFTGQKSLNNHVCSRESYIASKQISLGYDSVLNKDETMQYVPILDSLRGILKHEDVVSYVLNASGSEEGILSSYMDGSIYKSSPFFQRHPQALQIILYNDDFGVTDPLGNKVSKSKVSGFYFVLGNLPPKFRSRLQDIHLLLACPSALVSKYGYGTVLGPFLQDMKLLEDEGIRVTIHDNEHHFFGTLTMLVADNLAAHAIGGYFCNFSTVDRFCRFCMVSRDELNDVCSEILLRSKEMYDEHVSSVQMDPTMASVYGTVSECCLNNLQFFHIVDGCPPDVSHDVYEGFAKDLVKLLIQHLISSKYFSLSFLNERIQSFPYCEVDKKNKPQTLYAKSMNKLKVKQTASEMATFLRLLPFYVGMKVPRDDEHWCNYISFLDIVNYLTATSLAVGDVVYLQSLIQDFLEEHKRLYPAVNLKPKSHFLRHYPSEIMRFGPLMKTIRFESKNGKLKSYVHFTKNRKNTCQSIAKLHQMAATIRYEQENFLEERPVRLVYSSEVQLHSLNLPLQTLILEQVPSVSQCFMRGKAAHCHGDRYTSGECVLLSFRNDDYVFGLVKDLFIISGDLYILCNTLEIELFDTHFNAYQVVESAEDCLVKSVNLLHHHPIGIYVLEDKQYVVMHTFVPYEFIH